jgi:23S rRNA (guanine745-N1)-methyltransferase
VTTLVGMGPSAWHTDPAELRTRVEALAEPVAVTARIRVSTYSTVSSTASQVTLGS